MTSHSNLPCSRYWLPPVATAGELTTNVVHHCDALDLLRALPDASVDCVVTDPPYGLAGRVFEFPHKRYSAVNEAWDYFAPIEWMGECQRILKPGGSVLCFAGRQSMYKFAAEGLRLGWRIVNDITWVKPNAPPNFTGRMMTETTERCLWFCPDGTKWTYNLQEAKGMNLGQNLRDVWFYSVPSNNRLHPTQKPYELMERIVRLFTASGDLILDPFAGSGTTGVAARNLNRRYIMGDSSAEYVDVARKRLALPFTRNMFEVEEASA